MSGTSLSGSLAGARWNRIVDEDGSSVAAFTVEGSNTWATTGSAIQPTRVDNNASALVVTGVGDPATGLSVIEAEVQVGPVVTTPYVGVGLLVDPSSLGLWNGGVVLATRSNYDYQDTVLVDTDHGVLNTAIPYTDWVTLRIEAAFGVFQAKINGTIVQTWSETPLAVYPAIVCQFNGSSTGGLVRNLRAWSSNPGPFS